MTRGASVKTRSTTLSRFAYTRLFRVPHLTWRRDFGTSALRARISAVSRRWSPHLHQRRSRQRRV